ncbi:hypothetical protein ACERII_09405 [Evansella sp. AB-rgal1]|uniref:hypothetical protein n=1 Tax=Evansella sp. AB-rgal1 TaxID=3242696 RepID=UPI00359EF5A8
MDIFTIPDPSEGNLAYGYIILILVFIAASFTVNRLKKATRRQSEKNEQSLPQYELGQEEPNKEK